ncbi:MULTISPECIES: cysteine/glutathione ABC transporter permease/ATP-binding protein CydD [unclassified Vibrio]|uniref:Cysteine/glutathione ABC transporter permease/ATP-binding protein CydD n=1 Tax=Vibrio sp. HB236076 TaxID=3232307 RepID=A0AB39HCR3_9VIBR|nr:cysteine/glutathione ABC transporter permease/ATP-binding protein CydD [Vibrio sp. HB161653]MDP5253586.1 cysteine/glutathione ABC transporter permease/ATP-binding protein CydD [Vibrio sp. HB161653]
MDRKKLRTLNTWLKQQSNIAKRWLVISIALGMLSSVFLIAQAALLASLLHQLIIEQVDKQQLVFHFLGMIGAVIARSGCAWAKEYAGFRAGELIRVVIRQRIMDKVQQLGPTYIKGKPAGAWATLLIEQVENMHDFFARYLPQMSLSVLIPFVILAVVFPINWAAGLIFLITAPLVPLFMALVGMKAADANRKNFKAMQRLSGHFYDRLQSLTTLRLFHRVEGEAENLRAASEVFRERTMDILRIAFLSSAVLEFFTSVSIAITAVYFGFSYIGELDFGYYGAGISLFAGLFILILAPEFYQPLRDLGTYYHAKQQAIGAAESLVEFLQIEVSSLQSGETPLRDHSTIAIEAKDLIIYSPEGDTLAGPLTFSLSDRSSTALVGPSGAGKTSLVNTLLGFMPYEGSLTINGQELKSLDKSSWRQHISWIGQNPLLLTGTIRDNLSLSGQTFSDDQRLRAVVKDANADDFVERLGLDYPISDRSGGLSVGQAQRIALARAMLQHGQFWILDEPTASLDANSERLVLQGMAPYLRDKTQLMVTHQLSHLQTVDQILVMDQGQIVQQGNYQQLSTETGRFKSMLAASLASLQHTQQGNLDA